MCQHRILGFDEPKAAIRPQRKFWQPDRLIPDVFSGSYPQQLSPAWIGGHGTLPYEQYTQQPPGFGLSTVAHPLQS